MKLRFPLILIAIGLALLVGGSFATTDLTPLGQMDCGCGGGQACITKESAIDFGLVLTVLGAIAMTAGSLLAVVKLKAQSAQA